MKQFLFSFIIVLCLASCGQKKASDANGTTETLSTEATTDTNVPSDPDEPIVGNKFKDFNMGDMDGKPHSLSEYIGPGKTGRKHYVLVDFWASWCGPCMMEMPNVKDNWEMYRSQGFDVVGVSLDTDKVAWTKAVRDNGYYWPQLCDFTGFDSPVVGLYKIEAIPWNMLIDESGTVIAANLRGQELSAKLQQLYQ